MTPRICGAQACRFRCEAADAEAPHVPLLCLQRATLKERKILNVELGPLPPPVAAPPAEAGKEEAGKEGGASLSGSLRDNPYVRRFFQVDRRGPVCWAGAECCSGCRRAGPCGGQAGGEGWMKSKQQLIRPCCTSPVCLMGAPSSLVVWIDPTPWCSTVLPLVHTQSLPAVQQVDEDDQDEGQALESPTEQVVPEQLSAELWEQVRLARRPGRVAPRGGSLVWRGTLTAPGSLCPGTPEQRLHPGSFQGPTPCVPRPSPPVLTGQPGTGVPHPDDRRPGDAAYRHSGPSPRRDGLLHGGQGASGGESVAGRGARGRFRDAPRMRHTVAPPPLHPARSLAVLCRFSPGGISRTSPSTSLPS